MEKQFALLNGLPMPSIGFGTYKLKGEEATQMTRQAIETGYRLFDTAAMYENEAEVGKALQEAIQKGVPREELFVVTKVWKTEMGYDKAKASFEESFKKLGLDAIDLLLIHWPDESDDVNVDTWKALEDLYKNDERLKAIGISNFSEKQLETLFDRGTIKPMVNQYPSYPGRSNQALLDFCHKEGIVSMAYSPINRGEALGGKLIQQLTEKYGKTPAQIALRWALDRNIIPIPKTGNSERLVENYELFDFELTPEEVQQLLLLD